MTFRSSSRCCETYWLSWARRSTSSFERGGSNTPRYTYASEPRSSRPPCPTLAGFIGGTPLRIRYLGHSCVEIVGKAHIVIDPDFARPPEPDIEYICATHAHLDHLGRVAELGSGQVLASASVCRIAEQMGVPRSRLHPVKPGDTVGNIRVLPGYSIVGGLKYMAMKLLFKRKAMILAIFGM